MTQGRGENSNAGDRSENNRNALGVLVVVCVVIFFGVLNASAVGVALPDIAVELDLNISQLSWIITVFILVYGVAIPFYGRLADLYGARSLFIIGIGLFAAGSLLSAFASDFPTLFGARIVQALGGAAAPGLGMTLASRAYGPSSRGMVIGVIGATIGVGSGAGPLLGGALASAWGWESIFVASAVSALVIPFAIKVLPRDEDRASGRFDIIGGVLLAVAVAGLLLAPTEASRSGWASPLAVTGIATAVIAFIVLALHQQKVSSPFIPLEFVRNRTFVALGAMSFLVMAASFGPIVSLPIMLAAFNGSSALEIGVALVPGAVLSAVSGVVAGRLVDSVGSRPLIRVGGLLMLIAVLGLSTVAGDSVWLASLFVGVLGTGFGLVNTPLATAVTRVVRPQLLGSALGVNSMLFFIGASIGVAALLGFSAADTGASLNPLHHGLASGFSDGFLFLAIPVIAVLILTSKLPVRVKTGASDIDRAPRRAWTPDCSVPWSPEVEHPASAAGTQGV